MGGSHLAGDLFLRFFPEFPLRIHSDYGLAPEMGKEKNELIILSSYSGNTEEVLDAYAEAKRLGKDMAVITVGGRLLEMAKEDEVPYILLPDTGIQPRSALGFSTKALFALLGKEEEAEELEQFVENFSSEEFEMLGKQIADEIFGKVPVIYASKRNYSLAYNWKIKLNETGKVPAFYNLFPELNHNEMNGFDKKDSHGELFDRFVFFFLFDEKDHSQNQKRMNILADLYTDRGFTVKKQELRGENEYEKVFASLILADWISLYTAEKYGLDPEQVPLVEEFKHKL